MKVLGVVCSPRLDGNTQILVQEALRAAAEAGAETELYLAGQKNIAPCDGCESCQSTGECLIGDDMEELCAKLLAADGIIFGSPVYYWSVSAQAKVVIDRMFRFRQRRDLTGKVAGALVVARTRGESSALSTFLSVFALQRMVLAAAGSARGDGKGDVWRDAAGIEEARRVGKAVATLAGAGRLLQPDS